MNRLVHVTTTDMSLALLLGPQLRAFADAGYEVIGASAPGPYVEELTALGIRHVPLRHATRAMRPHRDVAAFFELRRLFGELQPEIVHTHNPKPGLYGRLAARAARVPVVVNTVHGLYALPDDRWLKRFAVYRMERLAARCSHAELVQSREDLATLRSLGVPAGALRHLGNGVDLARFDPAAVDPHRVEELRSELGARTGEVLVGAVGRLVVEKGYRELFEAAERLAGHQPPVRFVVVGPADPDKADAIDDEAVARAEAAGVVFLGFRHDMVELYAAMDLFALASYREGFPRAAMEAAAMGVPVVATDIRGCRDVVEDDVNGRLVAVRDASMLAEAVSALARDAEARTRMGRAAVGKARTEFDDRAVVRITLDTYAELLEQQERSACW